MKLIHGGEFQMGSREPVKIKMPAAGSFPPAVMKQYRSVIDSLESEHPVHKVTISRGFYLGQTELTVGQFRQFVSEENYKTDAERSEKGGGGFDLALGKTVFDRKHSWKNPGFSQNDNHPATLVSWNDATAFCKWLSQREGATYSLPTEAQWEYACRAGTGRKVLDG